MLELCRPLSMERFLFWTTVARYECAASASTLNATYIAVCFSGVWHILLQVDLDLGNYERFLDISLTRKHNLTTGKIYQVRRTSRSSQQTCVDLRPCRMLLYSQWSIIAGTYHAAAFCSLTTLQLARCCDQRLYLGSYMYTHCSSSMPAFKMLKV